MFRYSSLLIAALVVAACGEGPKEGGDAGATPQVSTATPGVATPDPGGRIIAIEMETQTDGSNVFEPPQVEAKRGDVLRFILISGVHNANFLPDSNPGKAGLPAATPLLQLPGQSYDIKVNMAPGQYYFHCDPHWLLGMIGHLTVTE